MISTAEKTFDFHAPFVKVYTGAHFHSGIPMLDRIVLAGLPKGYTADLAISILGIAGNTQALKFSANIPAFSPAECSFDSDCAVLNLRSYRITPEKNFIESLSQKTELKLYVKLSFGEYICSKAYTSRLLPFGYLSEDMPYELLCTYVMPGSDNVRRIAKAASSAAKKDKSPYPFALRCARAIFSQLISENLTYLAASKEFGDGECVIRDIDTVLSSPIKNLSLTETALLFCACAEKCGISSDIIFLRKGAGALGVLVGINVESDTHFTTSESILLLRDMILSKKLFAFDVQSIPGSSEADFSKCVSETTTQIFKSSSSLSFMVNVEAARAVGVVSLRPAFNASMEGISSGFDGATQAVADIYGKDFENTMRSFSPYTSCAVGIAPDAAKLTFGKEYTLSVLDNEIFSKSPDSVALFTSFSGKYPPRKSRNNNEQAQYSAVIGSLRDSIRDKVSRDIISAYPLKYMLTCEKPSFDIIRREFVSETDRLISHAVLSEISGRFSDIYAICGVVEFLDDSKVKFAPCSFVPCKLKKEEGAVKLTYGTETAIENKSLISHITATLGENPNKDLFPGELYEYFLMLSEKYPDKIKYHPDLLISSFDLSHTLMRGCVENSTGASFEEVLECGKYEAKNTVRQDIGRYRATLPFYSPSQILRGVKSAEADSTVLCGEVGTGKELAVANFISRAALFNENILVSSIYADSLHTLYGMFQKEGLSEICLPLTSKENMREKILADIEKYESEPEYPFAPTLGDVALLEDSLDTINEELYSEHSFGYSLFDCINKYNEYDLLCPQENIIGIDTELEAIGKNDVAALCEISEKIVNSAEKIVSHLNGETITECGLATIKTTHPISAGTRQTLSHAIDEISQFYEKSADAAGILGISDASLPDMRSFIAFGEFLELILKSGVTYIPDMLFSASTYRLAKESLKFCDSLDELTKIKEILSGADTRLYTVGKDQLQKKWSTSEANPFAKKNIAQEICGYFPEKEKLSIKEAGKIINALMRKSELEEELSLLSEDALACLGKVYNGTETDVETARSICNFAISADSLIKKIFRHAQWRPDSFCAGVANLISSLAEENPARTDFILAVSAFKKLSVGTFSEGLLQDISKEFSCDLYDLKFENGVLGKDGISKYLSTLLDNFSACELLPEYNKIKKSAASLGISSFISCAEESASFELLVPVFKKSIFHALASFIMSGKDCFSQGGDIAEKYLEYSRLCEHERKLAGYNLMLARRKNIMGYINSTEGKNELSKLTSSLEDHTISPTELFSRHFEILSHMYCAFFVSAPLSLSLSRYPATLILMDSEKTDANMAIPLCARFEKCIFSGAKGEAKGSIMSAIPEGIQRVNLTEILPGALGHTCAFICDIFSRSMSYVCECDNSAVKFIKCSGGLYDKNTCTNRIEAIKVCETAVEGAKTYGLDNVAILAMTEGQVLEIRTGLSLIAKKMGKAEIAQIPVRYIGSVGNLAKNCIVLSTVFGKNIYSITKSFGVLDNNEANVLYKLLLGGKSLYVVSGIEPEEIMTDGAFAGAGALSSLLYFAKHCSVINPFGRNITSLPESSTRIALEQQMTAQYGETAKRHENSITSGNHAIIFEDKYVRYAYDRIAFAHRELEDRGYKTSFLSICDAITNQSYTISKNGDENID